MALATTAPITAASPTPPRPNTATDWPARTEAVFRTAPAPVSTAHPNSAAVGSGTSRGTTTADSRATTACRAKPETPRWWWSALPPRSRSRDGPCSSVPAPFTCAAGVHSAGLPEEHSAHSPQLGTKVSTT